MTCQKKQNFEDGLVYFYSFVASLQPKRIDGGFYFLVQCTICILKMYNVVLFLKSAKNW